MATFTRIPYAEATRRGHVQDRIVYETIMGLAVALIAMLLTALLRFSAIRWCQRVVRFR